MAKIQHVDGEVDMDKCEECGFPVNITSIGELKSLPRWTEFRSVYGHKSALEHAKNNVKVIESYILESGKEPISNEYYRIFVAHS